MFNLRLNVIFVLYHGITECRDAVEAAQIASECECITGMVSIVIEVSITVSESWVVQVGFSPLIATFKLQPEHENAWLNSKFSDRPPLNVNSKGPHLNDNLRFLEVRITSRTKSGARQSLKYYFKYIMRETFHKRYLLV